jgi:hypothetical protein
MIENFIQDASYFILEIDHNISCKKIAYCFSESWSKSPKKIANFFAESWPKSPKMVLIHNNDFCNEQEHAFALWLSEQSLKNCTCKIAL